MFESLPAEYAQLPHPQPLRLAERMERAVYLGPDEKKLTAKLVAGRKIL